MRRIAILGLIVATLGAAAADARETTDRGPLCEHYVHAGDARLGYARKLADAAKQAGTLHHAAEAKAIFIEYAYGSALSAHGYEVCAHHLDAVGDQVAALLRSALLWQSAADSFNGLHDRLRARRALNFAINNATGVIEFATARADIDQGRKALTKAKHGLAEQPTR